MRNPLLMVPIVMVAGVALIAPLGGCEQLSQALGNGGGSSSSGSTDAGATPDTTTDAGVVGGGCGTESSANIQLCTATSQCPSVVVDTSKMPNCGFRIRGSVVDLVCVCNGTFVCPFGTYATCSEASSLLASQSQAEVCTQITESRCTELTTTATTSSSSSSSTSSGGTACDRDCVVACGGGAACANVCNCN